MHACVPLRGLQEISQALQEAWCRVQERPREHHGQDSSQAHAQWSCHPGWAQGTPNKPLCRQCEWVTQWDPGSTKARAGQWAQIEAPGGRTYQTVTQGEKEGPALNLLQVQPQTTMGSVPDS